MRNLHHKKYSGFDELIALEEMTNYKIFIVSQSLKHKKIPNKIIAFDGTKILFDDYTDQSQYH